MHGGHQSAHILRTTVFSLSTCEDSPPPWEISISCFEQETKKSAAKKLAREVIKTDDVAGKPEWFDALVTKVIKEGDDVTKGYKTKERQIVHQKNLVK